MNDQITRQDLEKLPSWAIVAFAARRARRMQPLFAADWSSPMIERALALTELSARLGRAEDGLAKLIATVSAALYRPATGDVAASADPLIAAVAAAGSAALAAAAQVNAATARGAAAHAAAHYADSFSGTPLNASYPAGLATPGFAVAARADLAELSRLAAANLWTNTSPVDMDHIGPLWWGQEPEWWPQKQAYNPTDGPTPFAIAPADDPLELRIRVPVGASDAEIRELVVDFVKAASKTHMTHGGSGLKPDTVKIYECVLSPAEIQP